MRPGVRICRRRRGTYVTRIAYKSYNLPLLYRLPLAYLHNAAMSVSCANAVAVVNKDVIAPARMIFGGKNLTVRRSSDLFTVCISGCTPCGKINTLVIRVAVPACRYGYVWILKRTNHTLGRYRITACISTSIFSRIAARVSACIAAGLWQFAGALRRVFRQFRKLFIVAVFRSLYFFILVF